MDRLLFSQIPSVVLNRLPPDTTRVSKKSKTVKFLDSDQILEEENLNLPCTKPAQPDSSSENKGSQYVKTVQPILDLNKVSIKEVSDNEDESVFENIPKNLSTADAIIQADTRPKLVDKHVQTDESFMQTPPQELYEAYMAQMKAMGLETYKPLYQIPRRRGTQPPLKLGLTLPKGKKRRIYYPDEDD